MEPGQVAMRAHGGRHLESESLGPTDASYGLTGTAGQLRPLKVVKGTVESTAVEEVALGEKKSSKCQPLLDWPAERTYLSEQWFTTF